MHALRRLLSTSLLLLAAGCSESDATALRVRLAADLSGELQVSALALPEEPAPIEAAVVGVKWTERARISLAAGEFSDVRELELGDLSFEAELRADGLSFVRARMPRGAGARWFRALTTVDEPRRERVAEALEPGGGAELVGAMIKLVIEPPAPVVSSSAGPTLRGMTTETKKASAALELPVEALLSEGEPLVWTVIW